jgi:hypothetical protein
MFYVANQRSNLEFTTEALRGKFLRDVNMLPTKQNKPRDISYHLLYHIYYIYEGLLFVTIRSILIMSALYLTSYSLKRRFHVT